jgi:hypothetical protein
MIIMVEGFGSLRICNDFSPEEMSRKLEILAADDDDLCSAQNLLGNN